MMTRIAVRRARSPDGPSGPSPPDGWRGAASRRSSRAQHTHGQRSRAAPTGTPRRPRSPTAAPRGSATDPAPPPAPHRSDALAGESAVAAFGSAADPDSPTWSTPTRGPPRMATPSSQQPRREASSSTGGPIGAGQRQRRHARTLCGARCCDAARTAPRGGLAARLA